MSITTHFSRKLNLLKKENPVVQNPPEASINVRKCGARIGGNPKKPNLRKKQMTVEERLEKFREYELEYGENLERLYPIVKRRNIP